MPKKSSENLEFLERVEIRTMKKDIAWLQSGGKELLERKKKEMAERQRQRVEEIKRLEEERKKVEQIQRMAEEEKKRREEEEKRAEEQRKKEMEEARKKAEEEQKRIEEELRKKEEAGILQQAERQKIEEERQKILEELRKKEEEEKRRLAELKRKTEEELKRKMEEEEEKRREEERRRKEEQEKRSIAEGLRQIAQEKLALDQRKSRILERMRPVEKTIDAISKKERAIEEELRKIEQREAGATTEADRREAEKKRWKMEEKRKEIEKERLPWDEEKIKFQKQLADLELAYQEVLIKEEGLKQRQREIFAKEERIKLVKEREELEELLQKIQKDKEQVETKRNEAYKSLLEVEDDLKVVLEKERKAEEDKALLDEEEQTAPEEEKPRIKKERWEIEEKRRQIEKERWATEDKKNKIEIQIKKWETSFRQLEGKTLELAERIKEIDSKLTPEQITKGVKEEVKEEARAGVKEELKEEMKEEKMGEKEPTEKIKEELGTTETEVELKEKGMGEKEEKIEEVQKRRIEEAKKRVEAFKREMEKEKTEKGLREREIAETVEKTEKKKPDFKINEKEAEEEKKRVPSWGKLEKEWKELETKQKEMQKEFLKRTGEEKMVAKPSFFPQKPVEIIRPLPEKPSFREKFAVRIAVLSLVILTIGGTIIFWYWFFKIRVPAALPPPVIGCLTDVDCPNGQICQSGECIATAPPSKIVVPPPLFLTEKTEVLSVSSPSELKNKLLETVQEQFPLDQFKRVVIENTTAGQVFKLKDFFEALLIRAPEELYQKLENDFTLFVYSQAEGNRLGLAVQVKRSEGLAELLSSWERTLESDFQPFFELMGKTEPAIAPYFRNSNLVRGYVGPNFRYQTFTRQDLGILYLINENYLILTSSWKSMEKTIAKLSIPAKSLSLTSDLKLGGSGSEVELLQTWLKEEPLVYPEGLITGNFGNLTRLAVIRFQEKYASEILAPQGLTKGTGLVDSYTRIKLNELYGKSGVIPPVLQITLELRYGDRGNEVMLLQTWLAKDEEIYKKAVISGWFGPLTQQAVIRFQEKYASEILAPQRLIRGTGVVDVLTRKKLNELYGQQ